MLVDQYIAWDAAGNKITADSDWSLKFELRATAIFREREVYNAGTKRFDTEISKARD